jgi:hypothetical protein
MSFATLAYAFIIILCNVVSCKPKELKNPTLRLGDYFGHLKEGKNILGWYY